jgi:hypothetical protein
VEVGNERLKQTLSYLGDAQGGGRAKLFWVRIVPVFLFSGLRSSQRLLWGFWIRTGL